MIRTRDLVAAVGLLWLSSTAWNMNEASSNNNSSIAASIFLAFYVPTNNKSSQQHTVPPPAVLDVDGDGTPEALAQWTTTSKDTSSSSSSREFVLQVLDLRPLSSQRQRQRQAMMAPFQPNVLLESEVVAVVQKKNRATEKDAEVGGGAGVAVPLHVTTGQVLTSDVVQPPKVEDSHNQDNKSKEDRTVHYFCGTTWHDAAERCHVPCPSGQVSDCPDGEKCFADTPCNSSQDAAVKQTKSPVYGMLDSLHTTPAGGWPSVFTAWGAGSDDENNDGSETVVTMHSLTAKSDADTDTASGSGGDGRGQRNKNKQRRTKQQPQQLQIQPMWQVNPLQPAPGTKNFNSTAFEWEWDDLAVEFVDALSSMNLGSRAGVLLLTGTVYVYKSDDSGNKQTPMPGEADESEQWSTFVLALDALTGQTVWESFADAAVERALRGRASETQADMLLPITAATRGTTSAARRRSLLPANALPNHDRNVQTGTSVANCLREYRGSLLTSAALPYQYVQSDDVTVRALHFDHRAVAPGAQGVPPARPHQRKRQRKSGGGSSSWLSNLLGSQKGSHSAARPLHYGRPNVVVTHNAQGLHVQSLKNGRSLCHLSLQEDTLYADVNRDGTLDSLQIVTNQKATAQLYAGGDDDAVAQERKWVQQLAAKVATQNQQRKSRSKNKKVQPLSQHMAAAQLQQQTPLCHLLALSGIPSKEELFSTSLCYTSKKGIQDVDMALHLKQSVRGAPLLVVEPTSRGGRRAQNHRGHDLVAAVSTGFVVRIRGNTGRRLWKRNGRRPHAGAFPTWDDDTAHTVLLDRVSAANRVVPSMRPIVLAGENSAALLAPGSGQLLGDVAVFPQPSRKRPQLVDFDGDGTLDLLVSTRDAVWGYKIVVTTGASVLYRIVVGLLVMGLMLAFLRNRFGKHPGKRSTDL